MQSENRTLARLPERSRGPYANKFRKVDIVSNHFEATLKGIEKIVVFSLKVEPKLDPKDIGGRKKIQDQIRDNVAKCLGKPVFRGFNVFSSQEYNQTLIYSVGEYKVTIAQKSVYEVAKKPDVFKMFLNVSLRGMMSRLGFIQIGRSGKYFNTDTKKSLDNLTMYSGYVSSFT